MANDRSRPKGTSSGSSAPTAKAGSDAYTGLLVVSLLAQLAAAVFLYLDYSQYPTDKPTLPAVAQAAPAAPPGGVAPGGPGGAPPGPGAPGVPPPGPGAPGVPPPGPGAPMPK